uniref:two-component system sensor histidine kinase SapS n=1 Tax=Candidatus Enterococcus willemsii TaxID=1857215 RepID=UPI00403F2707
MTIWKYLKDQWWVFIGWFLFIVLTAFVIWLTPDVTLSIGTLGYLVLMQAVILGIILTIHYLSRRRWWHELTYKEGDSVLQKYLTSARTEEEKLHQAFINQVIREHQENMQQVVTNQEEQKDYIDSWVHEIKVPLAATQLLLRSVEFDLDDAKYVALENELLRIDEYVDQVLYVARLDSFTKDYLIRETSLKQLIQPVLRSQANYFIQKNIHFTVEGDDQQVLTDGKWISFIFRQLLSNAIKYTPVNGTITIQMIKKRQGIQLKLTDSGIGIPKEDLRRIFDKGFTGKNGRNAEVHSTGLGLYLAKNLASQLGVQLSVKSKVGQGTTMTLFFPMLSYYEEER